MAAERRALPPSSTTTFGAGARSQAMKRLTCSALASSQATPTRPKNSNQSFKLIAYALAVLGERSSACRCAM